MNAKAEETRRNSDAAWNPRYVQFARVNGRTPEEQSGIDKAKPTRMIDFMLWIQGAWRRWRAERGFTKDCYLSAVDVTAFDAWLSEVRS